MTASSHAALPPSSGDDAILRRDKPGPLHLDYLDGLRGLSALYVVLVHLIGQNASRPDGGGRIGRFLVHDFPILIWGTDAVCVFIVLSGYCLMLPVAKSGTGDLRGGAWEYLRRRGRRILPPYYAALMLSLLLIALTPLRHGIGTEWDVALPVSLRAVLTHVLLVHNLTSEEALKINAPLWSVATEWQIYFVFPLLFLPVWRRLGVAVLVVFGLVLGIAPHYVFHGRFDSAMPEMLALFALGMAAADISFSARALERGWREALPWGTFALVGVALVVSLSLRGAGWVAGHFVWVNPIVGVTAACLLVHGTRQMEHAPRGRSLLRLLNSRTAVTLGAFSYSLYLIHWPLLAFVQALLRRAHVSAPASFAVSLAALPVIICLAYLFHLAFERPFMSKPAPRGERQAEAAAIVSPAP